jgi:hypothetical protein
MLLQRHFREYGERLAQLKSGHETLRHWRLDSPTPMERVRILDPAPDRSTIQLTHRCAFDLLAAKVLSGEPWHGCARAMQRPATVAPGVPPSASMPDLSVANDIPVTTTAIIFASRKQTCNRRIRDLKVVARRVWKS